MISQIELIAAICTELDRQGVKSLHAHQYNAIIAAADEMIRELKRPPKMAEANMGLEAWLSTDDVGLSSKYMASVLGGGFIVSYAHPHDVDDFGRCSRLLLAVPEYRGRLPWMRDRSPQWAGLVAVWADIETLIAEGQNVKANALIRQAIESSE